MSAGVKQVEADVAELAACAVSALSADEVVDDLTTLHRVSQMVAAHQLRLVQRATELGTPGEHGHRSLTSWLRATLLLDPRPAREMAERAVLLRHRPAVEQALQDGRLDARQAAVIAATVDAIPATLRAVDAADAAVAAVSGASAGLDAGLDADLEAGPAVGADAGGAGGEAAGLSHAEIVRRAEGLLIERAGEFPALQLRRLGERILSHVAPEIAERADELALRHQEARALALRGFSLSPAINGQVHVRGALDVQSAAVIRAALEPLCTPRPDDERTPAQRRADALAEICQLALNNGELPEHGGEPPQVAVTTGYDHLARRLGIGTLDNGDRVSAAAMRGLACAARVLPVVLGGAGQVLDVGRARRLVTAPLRRALSVRDGGCAHPGCDRPPRWTDAHHIRPWTAGGPTSLDNLVLLCRHHHRMIHDERSGWRVRAGDDHRPEFLPPPWLDPAQRPRRNGFHQRT
ncbi:HNH endonuclease signature motif containing protein [Actinoplanes sp. N902-109]|uniref:HNH endonuclease signature motif containing protein n=1 Tax=Actinoplanes sp. (strain N902-109) TaxID=649831 RepID=UPI0012F824CD|nr:HNH endonuclease signature motif containing protein [Actinoplanes sp. N902-109]